MFRLLRFASVTIGLFGLALLLAIFLLDMEIYRKDSVERSFSTFVSLQPASEYVVVKLSHNEVFEYQEYHRILGDYPIGDTRVSISLPVTYHYFVKPDELSFELMGDTLHVRAKALYLQHPVAFDTQRVLQGGEKNWFGRAVGLVLDEFQKALSGKLRERGKRQLRLARKQAYESLAENIHQFLISSGQPILYRQIAISFLDEESPVEHVFSFDQQGIFSFPLGDRFIFIP